MRALLFGYYGFNNAGDELILKSIISGLKKKDSSLNLTVLSSNPALTQKYTNTKAYYRWNAFSVIYALCKADIVIFGGGGLIQDKTGALGLYFYLLVLVFAKLMGKTLFAYSISANRVKKANSYFVRFVLNLFSKITVRDEFTYKYFESISVKREKLILSSDPLLSVDINVIKRSQNSKKLIFVPRQNFVDSNALSGKIAEVLSEVSDKTGYSAELVPFQECDLYFSRMILDSSKRDIKIYSWNYPSDLYEYFKTGDFVLSMRLHGLILASLYAIPCAGISNDNKLSRFLDEIKQHEMFNLKMFDVKTCVSAVVSAISNSQNYRDNILKAYPGLQERSKKASTAFFDLIKLS